MDTIIAAAAKACWPKKPYCTDDLSHGVVIRPLATALRKRYVQINQPAQQHYLIFDVDKVAGAWAWDTENLPPPSWTVTGSSGHGHIVYTLKERVCRSAAARPGPMRWVKAIRDAITARLGADAGYAGLVTRNPLHPEAHTWHGPPSAQAGYELGYLAEHVTRELAALAARKNTAEAKAARAAEAAAAAGFGRNKTLFDTLRHYAYSIGSAHSTLDSLRFALTLYATSQNVGLFEGRALAESEVRHIVKSVAKYVHERRDKSASYKAFTERQSERGKASGVARIDKRAEARAEARQRHEAGETQAQIAQALGVTQSTVCRWLR